MNSISRRYVIRTSSFALALATGLIYANTLYAQQSVQSGTPTVMPGTFQVIAPLRRPHPISDSFMTPEARARLSEPAITYTYEFGVTNASCNTVLTPGQCVTLFSSGVDPQRTIKSAPISLTNTEEAYVQIAAVLEHSVSRLEQPSSWSLNQTLALQGLETISKRNQSMAQTKRKIPASVASMYRELGISHVEFRNRTIITGNRLLVETQIVDVTPKGNGVGNEEGPRLLTAPTVRDIIGFTDNLDQDLERSMETLGSYASEAIAKKQKASN